MVFDNEFLEALLRQAQESPRLRASYDLRTSADDNSQRILNALMPGTKVPVHRHPRSSESVVCLCGHLDEIIFVYYDCAEFAGEHVEYESYQTEGIPFCVPSLTLSDTLGFEGEHFTVSYTLNMIYDYDYASLDLLIEKGQLTYIKSVDVLTESGTVILAMVDGELGSVTVSAYLNFADSTLNGGSHRLLPQAAHA